MKPKANDNRLVTVCDKLKHAIESHAKGRCDGECAECRGSLTVVQVTHPNHDWGFFCYCEAAVQEDLMRGLSVRGARREPA